MDYQGVELVCPACRNDLRGVGDAFRCTSCSRRYPVIAGIPDLRLWPDPYIGIEEDRMKGSKLAHECSGLSFADSVELYYRLTTVVPLFQARAFTRALLSAVPRSSHSLERWRAECQSLGTAADTASGSLLEIGCGTAPLLVAASRQYRQVVGIDVAFRWLVLAKKRLAEAGVDAPVVCANAEGLPFTPGAFDDVALDSTIEHLRDQPLALSEAHRVMRAGGCLLVATPNKKSLGPDPHAGLWAGGWLPEAAIGWWVRRKGGIPPRRRLLSRRTLGKALMTAGFDRPRVFVPSVPAAQRDGFSPVLRRVIDVYNGVARTPPGRAVLLRIGPLLHAVARKPAGRA